MWKWIKAHPWIWIVVFFLFVMGANLAFVMISVYQRPIVLE